ncbi:MAG: DUF971 domain-containing protein [Phycisphaerales bacterium]|jgi:DUF971 family protein|nr:DUF971 domain-containing protein [Phycisphaerales bacterium]
MEAPAHLHLDRRTGLTVTWSDGSTSTYPVAHLRRWSPSAEAVQTRRELDQNPLAVLSGGDDPDELEATDIERVGHYAIRITFSDGHRTGLYSWQWLRSIAPSESQGSQP